MVSLGSIAGKWILPIMALSLLGSDAMNAYTGMLSLESVRSTFQKVTASRTARIIGLLIMFVAATILAEAGYKTFLTSFENFINVLLFFFVPWSVINLVDFYLVKKGRYDVKSFFTPKGIYGGWRWTALIPYVIALGAQVPFIDQTLYVGPMVQVLGGADISWLVGFVVAGVGYLIATRITGGQAQVAAPETPGRGQLLKRAMSGQAMIADGQSRAKPGTGRQRGESRCSPASRSRAWMTDSKRGCGDAARAASCCRASSPPPPRSGAPAPPASPSRDSLAVGDHRPWNR